MNETARILLIDDDESVRKTISKALEKAGYKVDTAENGTEALEKTRAKFYNLALIDIRLPDMEGTKLLTMIKDTTPRIVKIILTGYPALQNAIEAVNKGADAYITKPINLAELRKVIKEHLKKQAEDSKFGEQKIGEFVETRLKQLGTEETDKKMNKP